MRHHALHHADPGPGRGIFALPHRAGEALVHVVPVPFEATVSYGTGTADGPRAVRAASPQVDLLDPDFGRPHRVGIFQHPESARVRRWGTDARRAAGPVILGDIDGSARLRRARDRVDGFGARLNTWLEAEVDALLDDGRIVGVLGGDHSVPFGAIRAHAQRCPGLGILHFDAHFDLREAYEGFTWSHASIMHNVLTRIPEVGRLVQVGIRDYSDEELARARSSDRRVVAFLDRDLFSARHQGRPFESVATAIADSLPRNVYVSFDIDCLDPALCPGTGTPVPGGLSFTDAAAILDAVVRSGRHIVGFDLVEVAPQRGDGEWNANVGARLLYKLVGATVRSRVVGVGVE
ncbi:MAG: arginase [Phycisphaeraceae bacterium]|nr:arginase [Phycisphaeraceae bacterium]